MPNPKGSNAGTVGKKGRSGRKSAYEEVKIAQELNKAYNEGYTLEEYLEIAAKVEAIKSKEVPPELKNTKLTLFEITVWRAVTSDSILNSTLKKLIADKIDGEGMQDGLAGIFKAISEGRKRQRPPEEPPE
jgi:hypothetical protein